MDPWDDLTAGMALAALVSRGDGDLSVPRRFGGALAPAWARATALARKGRGAIPELVQRLRPQAPPGLRGTRPVDRGVARALARIAAGDDRSALAAADRVMLEAIAWRE